ncbi:MAG: Bug family tripartite tricarboxylate transporter substrate binding protein, partial [Burkholderiales bacterium]
MNRILLAGIPALLAWAGSVAAQEAYPTRPISLVSPYPPGGAADLTARPLAPALEKVLKQPVIVVNRTGAGGAVGTQIVSVAPADGYT